MMTLAVMAAPGLAGAATLQVVDGKLTGATGVDVGGTLYDVRFLEDTCETLFAGCDEPGDFPFPSEEDAGGSFQGEPPRDAEIRVALQALSTQVFLDTAAGAFDSDPGLTVGCPTGFCNIAVPYRRALRTDGRLGREVRTLRFVNKEPGSTGFDNDTFGFLGFDSGLDTADLTFTTFAVFTRAQIIPETPAEPETPVSDTPNVIPLPAAAWMLLAGLGTLGLFGRRARGGPGSVAAQSTAALACPPGSNVSGSP
jgi:hypothetical protein